MLQAAAPTPLSNWRLAALGVLVAAIIVTPFILLQQATRDADDAWRAVSHIPEAMPPAALPMTGSSASVFTTCAGFRTRRRSAKNMRMSQIRRLLRCCRLSLGSFRKNMAFRPDGGRWFWGWDRLGRSG